jgi:hypothetical protein
MAAVKFQGGARAEDARWEGRRRKGQLSALSTPGATCTRWGEWVSHEAMAWLAPALLFTSWKRAGGRWCQGAFAAAWPLASCLLGNQESQAQLIKLWVKAWLETTASPIHRSPPQIPLQNLV